MTRDLAHDTSDHVTVLHIHEFATGRGGDDHRLGVRPARGPLVPSRDHLSHALRVIIRGPLSLPACAAGT
jgi:hypothetical protein